MISQDRRPARTARSCWRRDFLRPQMNQAPSGRLSHFCSKPFCRSAVDARLQQILDADAPEQFGADTVGDAVDDLGAILRRIDMDAERSLAERHVDDPDDGF